MSKKHPVHRVRYKKERVWRKRIWHASCPCGWQQWTSKLEAQRMGGEHEAKHKEEG